MLAELEGVSIRRPGHVQERFSHNVLHLVVHFCTALPTRQLKIQKLRKLLSQIPLSPGTVGSRLEEGETARNIIIT